MLKTNFTILYVDDEEQNLVSFKATFRKEYNVLTATSGNMGIDLLEKHKVHLVITDQRMPGMTGVEFLSQILPDYPETIRILLTGFSDIDAVIDAINRGEIYRYITKPWDERDLRMTIENARQLYGIRIENIKAQFEMLKTQVNPHFLFNSLNVLSSLIHTNADAASQFIRDLSRVYRYVLDVKEMESQELSAEIEFLQSYIHLLEKRFDQNLTVEIDIPTEKARHRIVPMALQMLIENAIKHNVASRSKPLHISINTENEGYITVTNNLQPRDDSTESTGTGLANISGRYDYLTTRKVLLEKSNDTFSVKLPLL
ncbi:MAG: histidine kinase [Bacteroidetes bacterium]|nr:histidine kinase [Bacteroidota bacterium]MBU1718975.1 histidine kinase [Bacteroidota bacterium]